MDELKPCPFCGGKASLTQTLSDYKTNPVVIKNTFIVGCGKCDIYTHGFESEIYQTPDGKIHINATGAEEAIEVWNRRVGEKE